MEQQEHKKLITKLGIVFLIATILFTGMPVLFDFILIMNDKKQDFTFKHNHFILGAGLITGLSMVLFPHKIEVMVNKFLPK
jgi:hypothetical protein